ncbi:hypothetical protein ECEC4203_3191 [Escherichia coli EC4203]|nr:hypothetical protein ECEC4203_3191 [Escherichia coli EC4203]
MLFCLLCLPDSGKRLYLIWVNFFYLIQVNLPLSGKLYFSYLIRVMLTIH